MSKPQAESAGAGRTRADNLPEGGGARPAEAVRGGRVIAGRAVGTRELIAAAVVVVLLVIAGLALGGVFSGGKKHADTPTTTPSTAQTTTTSRVTTTASTTQPTNPSPLPVPTTTLKTGSNGAQVKQLQRALAQLGYKPGTVDGIFGPNTEAAVMRFQTSVKLAADGVAGPLTLAALGKALRNAG